MLSQDYRNFADPSESVQATEDTGVLINKLLSDATDNNLIVTSIQKMSRVREDGDIKKHQLEKIQSKHIVFIIDECHRDQKGEMHQSIKKTFPNAMYFGFSGTPDHGSTVDIFGDELHRYTIVHGIRDGNVLGFDPYKVCTYDDKALREKIALRQCNCSTAEEAIRKPETRDVFLYYMNKAKNKCPMTEIESFVPKAQYETEEHENAVVDDIIHQWHIRSVDSEFHALLATSSILEAIKYYGLFKSKAPDLKVTAVFDPSDNNSNTALEKMHGITDILTDYNSMFNKSFEIGTYAKFKKDVCERLAHKKDYINIPKELQINLVIVVDQLLTGFDSKWINTLYLDKRIEGKNLIQAISRTNRLFGPEKPHGTIIWYRYPHTMERILEEAVKEYSGDIPFGIFVDKLNKNLVQINAKYEEIKELFDSVGIENYESVYDDISWKKKFAKLFSELNRYLDSAKIQGFVWEQTDYNFNMDDGSVESISMLLDQRTYLVLVQRYKELFKPSPDGPGEVPYDIDTHITEIQTDAIDDEYINSKFKVFMVKLDIGDKEAKDNALKDLHKSFATLSEADQQFAKLFLNDIEAGRIAVEEGKTFRDYITLYKYNKYNDQIHQIAIGLGLDEGKLRKTMDLHLDKTNINAYGRYDDLIATIDIEKAQQFLSKRKGVSLSKREAMIEADDLLRQFILNKGFDV